MKLFHVRDPRFWRLWSKIKAQAYLEGVPNLGDCQLTIHGDGEIGLAGMVEAVSIKRYAPQSPLISVKLTGAARLLVVRAAGFSQYQKKDELVIPIYASPMRAGLEMSFVYRWRSPDDLDIALTEEVDVRGRRRPRHTIGKLLDPFKVIDDLCEDAPDILKERVFYARDVYYSIGEMQPNAAVPIPPEISLSSLQEAARTVRNVSEYARRFRGLTLKRVYGK